MRTKKRTENCMRRRINYYYYYYYMKMESLIGHHYNRRQKFLISLTKLETTEVPAWWLSQDSSVSRASGLPDLTL